MKALFFAFLWLSMVPSLFGGILPSIDNTAFDEIFQYYENGTVGLLASNLTTGGAWKEACIKLSKTKSENPNNQMPKSVLSCLPKNATSEEFDGEYFLPYLKYFKFITKYGQKKLFLLWKSPEKIEKGYKYHLDLFFRNHSGAVIERSFTSIFFEHENCGDQVWLLRAGRNGEKPQFIARSDSQLSTKLVESWQKRL